MSIIHVACRVPQGLMVGGVQVNGPNFGLAERNRDPKYPMPGGFVITEMSADAWNAWFKHNQDSEVITGNLIFADVDRNKVVARCFSFRRTRSGLEQGSRTGRSDVRAPTRPPGAS